MNISKRTLQSYRDKGILPYSQIEHKCYYRVADVRRLLEQNTDCDNPSRRL
jgi:DNA-binding transcriptional MerR regulator